MTDFCAVITVTELASHEVNKLHFGGGRLREIQEVERQSGRKLHDHNDECQGQYPRKQLKQVANKKGFSQR